MDMWRISPLFQGVGIALLTAQAFIGIYSIVGVSWMFVYFRYIPMLTLKHNVMINYKLYNNDWIELKYERKIIWKNK